MLNREILKTISENFPTVVVLALVATVVHLFKQNADLYERLYQNEREMRVFWQEAFILTDPTRITYSRRNGSDDDTTGDNDPEEQPLP